MSKEELVLSHQVAVSSEVDGIEMGVLGDGTAYLTGRALAKLCGVAVSTVINQANRWGNGERKNELAKLLVSLGITQESLYVELPGGIAGSKIHAYTDPICMAFLEYFSFESTPPSKYAQTNYRKLSRAGLRVFVYRALGYDPANRVPKGWRQFHDRLALHVVPSGYFSIFKEMADIVLASIQNGLAVDDKTVPDISVGQAWGKHWTSKKLAQTFGERIKFEHNYPDYFAQAKSNPQHPWAYPVDALPAFRRWMDAEYLPKKFPKYIKTKVDAKVLPPSTAELLLAAVSGTKKLVPA